MKNILVVDDQPDIQELLTDILANAGYSVSCASNGVIAEEVMQEKEFDLIITDIYMPDKDGLELITQQRSKSNSPPIIVISGGINGQPDSNYLSIAEKFGAKASLPKPFTTTELLDTVSKVIET